MVGTKCPALRTRLDDRGTSWQLGYDPLDRPTAARTGPTPFGEPDPTLPTWERHTAYDGLGQAKRVVENGLTTILDNARSGQVLAITAPGEGRRDVAYDRTGRPVVMLDAEGTLTVSLWDAAARTQTVSTVRRGLETEPLTTTVTETFDPLGRLVIRETVGDDGLEQTETWDHAGLTVTHTAPDGHQDVQVSNLAGLPVASQTTAAGGGWESTTYAYVLGGVGHEVQIQEPNGEWTTRTYDALGSMTAEARPSQGPNGAVWMYEHDGWGRETARHDPDGDSVFSCYDEDTGDLVATRTALPCDGAAAALLSTFEGYDDLGRATRATRRNVGGDVVTTERNFDAQGRVVRDALQVGGEPVLQVTSNWAAAATGWNRTLAYPTGAVWTRSNDRIGRLVGLAGPQGNDIALNWQGEFYAGRSHTRGGATALDELATLDGLGRRVGWDFTAGSTSANSATATRDVVGRVASLTWAFGPSAADHWRGYGYDPATRLADAWSWDGLAPGPDVSSLVNHTVGPGQVGTLAGSLAGVVHAPFTRAADGGDLLSIGDAYEVTSPRGPGHRLTEVEVDGVAVTVDHDATGRVVEVDPGSTFEYDPDERLMAVRDSGTGDVVERYAYDADGRLAATYDANGLTQRFAWDGAQMVAARDGNGVAKWDAVWGTLDQLLSWRDLAAHPVGDVAVLPITDHRGSVVGGVESDAGGTTLLAGADYTPMGRVATLDPTDDDAETCREEGNPGTRCAHPGGMPFGFAGAWRSEATGLVYMRFRWYSPTLAQFLTPDPMGEVDSWNLYAYVGGDPINRWEPWGLDASNMANAALDGKAPVDPSNTGAPVDHGGEPPPAEQSGHSMMPGVGPGHGGPRPPGRMPPPDPKSFPGPNVPRPPMADPIPLRPVPIAEPPTASSRVLWCFASPVNVVICLAAFIPASEPTVDPPADAVPLEAGPAGPEASTSAPPPKTWTPPKFTPKMNSNSQPIAFGKGHSEGRCSRREVRRSSQRLDEEEDLGREWSRVALLRTRRNRPGRSQTCRRT